MSGEINIQAKALALARQGLLVFPCRCVDKRPLTQNGFKDASTDPEVIRNWWALWPRAYIGVPTGDKFVVVDLDLQYPEALTWCENNCARLPLTRTHVTKSGGRHLLFKPHDKVGCTTARYGRTSIRAVSAVTSFGGRPADSTCCMVGRSPRCRIGYLKH
jgi:hypothetical protein